MTSPVTTERHGGVAMVTIDNPPVNALSQAVRAGIAEAIASAQDADAILLRGANGTFIAGADIREFGKPPVPPMLGDVCATIEASAVPVGCLLEGNTLGGGLEIALGCHYRFAVEGAKLGLPEVALGLIPGAGGTQRLPRLVKDVAAAMRFVTSGKPVVADEALAMGLIDSVVAGLDGASAALKALADEPVAPRRLSKRTPKASAQDLAAATDAVVARARGATAPLRAAGCLAAAYTVPFADGMKLERSTFVELMASDQSAALRHIFFAERQAAKGPPDLQGKSRTVERIGIIGAGTMGGGIAMTFAEAGLPVVLVERETTALERGVAKMRENWKRGLDSGRFTEDEMTARMGRVEPTTDFARLSDCDLVIEAVFETMAVKREVFAALDAVSKPGAVLATNTSYLDIDAIAEVTGRPGDVVGMHYFSPANVMPLLEIVRGPRTADDTLVTALAMAKRTRKQAVVAGNAHGFIGNRMLKPYQRQAHWMVLNGATPAQVDAAAQGFGMAMGPFAVSDLAGLDIGTKSRADQDLAPHEKALYAIADGLVGRGHLGQKSGAGFYRYDKGSRAPQDHGATHEMIAEARAAQDIEIRAFDDEEIVARLLGALVNEGAHVLAEGIAARSGDVDTVWVHGYGFPRWRGGPMFAAGQYGMDRLADAVEGFASGTGGEHWTVAPTLRQPA